jgi:UDP:flavonoid glycosyltransferase YjiC (YdhE family)
VTLGGSIETHEVRAAANTQVVHSAPHDQVLPHAAAVVTHGGHGTVIRALRHGLPVLVMPHGRDQNDNAARVVEAGAGLWLDAASETQAIRDSLRALIEDAALTDNAKRLGAAIAQEIAQSTIVEDMETLAGAPFHVSRV